VSFLDQVSDVVNHARDAVADTVAPFDPLTAGALKASSAIEANPNVRAAGRLVAAYYTGGASEMLAKDTPTKQNVAFNSPGSGVAANYFSDAAPVPANPNQASANQAHPDDAPTVKSGGSLGLGNLLAVAGIAATVFSK